MFFQNHKVFWNGEVFIQADVGTSLADIFKGLNEIGYRGAPSEWIKDLRKSNDEKETANQTKMVENTPDGYLNPLKILQCLDKVSFFKNNC